jgi:hypothetical protein
VSELENSARAQVAPAPAVVPDFDTWLRQGMEQGWCGPAVCFTHDGLPTTNAEDEEFDLGDPCLHILRLYSDDITRKGVEKNHSPSVWRRTNMR